MKGAPNRRSANLSACAFVSGCSHAYSMHVSSCHISVCAFARRVPANSVRMSSSCILRDIGRLLSIAACAAFLHHTPSLAMVSVATAKAHEASQSGEHLVNDASEDGGGVGHPSALPTSDRRPISPKSQRDHHLMANGPLCHCGIPCNPSFRAQTRSTLSQDKSFGS